VKTLRFEKHWPTIGAKLWAVTELVNLPGAPLVALSTLTVGNWCTISTYSDTAFCIVEARTGNEFMLARFSASHLCAPLVRTGTTQVTPIAAPTAQLAWSA
jgi:hypothetical protein